ncbi:Imm32 family immunity protein [Kitasatospora sp. NPDC004240]
MMQVLHGVATDELELSGTRPELLTFGRLLRGREGTVELSEDVEPFPYDRSLSRIVFQEEPERDTASIIVAGGLLTIRGGREALDLLAANIEDFAAEADARHHLHVDHPTYVFIAPGSHSLVLTFLK